MSGSSKKRKREKAVLYDHSTVRNRATASTFDFDFSTRRLKLTERVVEIAPKVDTFSPTTSDPAYVEEANQAQEIRDDGVGVVVRATTRAKRYLNSVSR